MFELISSHEMSLAQVQVCTGEAVESYNRVLKRKPVDVQWVPLVFAQGHVIGLHEWHWLSTDVQFYYADNKLFIYFGHDIAKGLKLYLDYSFSCKSYLSPCCTTDLLSCVCAFTL
jgi:hypothetical protein